METKVSNSTPLKVLTEWPLSKVELVAIGEKNYILKTVHPDFTNEAKRQQFLSDLLTSPLDVPRVLDVTSSDTETKILMEYIGGTEPSQEDALHVIRHFHNQTQSTNSEYFPAYRYEQFLRDCDKVKELLPDIRNNGLEAIFTTDYSIVHGDWKHAQLIKSNNTYCIIDFGRSFYGPSILDYGYYFKNTAEAGLEHFTQNKHQLLNAKLVVLIMQLEWSVRCRDNYIQYDYKTQIAETQAKMKEIDALLQNIAK